MGADAGPAAGFAAACGAAAHVFAGDLADQVTVAGDDGHHLQRVRRLRAGEVVTVADGSGGWRPYTVVAGGDGSLVLDATAARREEPLLAPPLAVAFALSKGTKPEQVVADLTELGVDRIHPFRSARSVVRWDETRARLATARMRRVVRESAMQCRRARVPEVAEPVDVASLAAGAGAATIVVGDPGGVPASEVALPRGGWLAVVGAEGGLDPGERAALLDRPGATLVAVGPHVLRAETAAVALAAALAGRRTVGG